MKLDTETVTAAAQRIGIAPDDLAAIVRRGQSVTYAAGDYLFHESTPRQWLGVVTEGGYFINAATGQFDPTAPEIVADAASPDAPATAFGAIIKALKNRRAAGVQPYGTRFEARDRAGDLITLHGQKSKETLEQERIALTALTPGV